MLKYLSLFSGIGAFESALTNLGVDYEVVNYCEIDKYASKSYSAIHGIPESKNLWDITKCNVFNLPKPYEIDLLTYGFPCQDISLAGKLKGLFNEDGSQTRSGLFFEAHRIIDYCKPKVAIAENVKNLTGKKFAEQFYIVLKSLEDAGYNNYWKVLNAKDYGIPQNRERVFIVSIRKDVDNEVFEFPKPYSLEKRLKDFLEPHVDEKYYLSERAIEGRMKTKYQKYKLDENLVNDKDVHPTILARYEGAPTLLQERVCNEALKKDLVKPYDIIDYTYSNARLKEMESGTIKTKNKQDNQIANTITTVAENFGVCVPNLKRQLCNTLIEQNLVEEDDVIRHSYTNNRLHNGVENMKRTQNKDKLYPTLDTRSDCFGAVVNNSTNLRIRKLTPKECFRLMGFNDKEFEKAQAAGISNAQLYKQAGNSIVVDVLEELFCMMLDENDEFYV